MTDYEIVETTSSEDNNDISEYSYISNGLIFEYFIGYEIASLLGYKNTKSVIINNVSKSNQLTFREYPGVKIPPLDPRTILITRDGVIEILLKTRKRISPDVLHLLKKFGIETTNRKCLSKEQQTLSEITNVFKTEKYEDQYKVGKYYLDLYFTDYKIVIECDENGHSDRRPSDEKERMNFVNNELNIDDSHWIRFNPDEYNFEISKVIGRIHSLIFDLKKKEFDFNMIKLTEDFDFKMKELKKEYENESDINLKKNEEYETKEKERIRKAKFRENCRENLKKPESERKYIKPDKAKKNINLDPEKPCTICGVIKKLEEFNPAIDHRDGRENRCIKCVRNRQAEILIERKKEIGNVMDITCNICEETKLVAEFYKDKLSPTGYMRRCKKCHKSRQKELQNKEKVMVDNKLCSRCNITKPIDDFHKRNVSRDGYGIYCKICACKIANNFATKKKT